MVSLIVGPDAKELIDYLILFAGIDLWKLDHRLPDERRLLGRHLVQQTIGRRPIEARDQDGRFTEVWFYVVHG